MAGELKQTFIEAVRLTPDGIQEFLDTPFPEAPTISTPADVDAAIIASGVLSKYLLDVFSPFAGLTPVELLLRIGQHNSVLESAMIAGLEYIEGADSEEQDLTFTEPAAGQSYTPGEVRFTVSAKNGTPARVMLSVDSGEPLKMTSDDGQTFTQYQTISATGAHSAEASAEFAAGDVKTSSVSFSIEEYDPENPPDPPPENPPAPPGGDDLEALTRARAQVMTAYRQLIRDLRTDVGWNPWEELTQLIAYFNAFKSAVNAFTGICPDDSVTIPKKADIARYLGELSPSNVPTGNVIVTKSSAIMDIINALYVYLKG